jgi:hypothetical protein
VDAIARVQLTARRLGRHVLLRGASPQLEELLRLSGLTGVVPCCAGSGLEPGRQPEEREEPFRVEEEGDPTDPVA